MFFRPSLFFAIVIICSAVCSAEDTPLGEPVEGEHFRVSVYSQLNPLAINTMHRWVIQVRDLSGHSVEGLSIDVSGGMPQHNHGLPTEPRVTEYLGDGRYLLEGVKFHMAGQWQMTFTLKGNGLQERLTLVIHL